MVEVECGGGVTALFIHVIRDVLLSAKSNEIDANEPVSAAMRSRKRDTALRRRKVTRRALTFTEQRLVWAGLTQY